MKFKESKIKPKSKTILKHQHLLTEENYKVKYLLKALVIVVFQELIDQFVNIY